VKHSKYEFLCISLIAFPCVVAQTIPDAGSLMRQNEQMFRQDQMQRNSQRREALPPALVVNDSTSVSVKRFKFNGNKLLSTEQLQQVAAPFANRELTKQDLQHLSDTVSAAYRQIGWIVQAYIPRQDLTGQELTIQVIESIPPNMSPR
jgi:hemolysin activation/secretion protein